MVMMVVVIMNIAIKTRPMVTKKQTMMAVGKYDVTILLQRSTEVTRG